MKKLGTILMACALVLGLSQCKKENTNTNANEEGEKVHVVLKVDDGQRSDVDPSGAYSYESGDVLLVGYNGAYCGKLTYSSGNVFSGDIIIPNDAPRGQYLNFYYIGNETYYVGEVDGTYTIEFNQQVASLPVVASAASYQTYPSSDHHYSTRLRNRCALVEFRCDYPITEYVYVNSINSSKQRSDGYLFTKASIDFSSLEFTPIDEGYGAEISLYSATSTSKWAILLPDDREVHTYFRIEGDDEYIDIAIPPLSANDYLAGENAIQVHNTPAGPVDYVFTVDADGTTVQFSPGNLQATTEDLGLNWNWHFAANEYEYIGPATANTSINGYGTVSANGTVDLFGWSTGENYGIGGSNNGAFVDWGGAIGGGWRTLKKDEWNYLFTERTNAENLYGFATINGTHGIIVLPDGSDLDFTDKTEGNLWSSNEYNSETWNNTKQSYGAVFLPATGACASQYIFENQRGYYWSSDANPGSNAYSLYFYQGGIKQPSNESTRTVMNCVRLVRDVD